MRTYVGSIDPETGHGTVVITDRDDSPEVDEIDTLLSDLAEVSDVRYLGRPDPDPSRRLRDRQRRQQLFDRIRTAGMAAEERPLPHRVLHSPDGFAWGDAGSGSADLAYAILQRELVEEVPPEVYLPFRDEVISRLADDGFRLPAAEVWDWIRANRLLVDEKMFGVEPRHPALAVLDRDAASHADGGGPPALTGPTASALVLACESAWADIRTRHPELPEVVIVLGSGVERGRLVKLGHWWGGRWIADGQVRGEVLLAGEALHLEPKQVFEVLLHEAAHGINAARGVKDTSRGGRYHNEKFASTAREVGLKVGAMPPYGMARTELTVDTATAYGASIDVIGDAMRIARQLDGIKGIGAEQSDGGGSGTSGGAQAERSRNAPGAACGCGRRMRMHASVLAQGPVVCGVCGTEFTTGAEVRHGVELDARSPTVDTSFQARRREALAAERGGRLRETLETERSMLAAALDHPSAGDARVAGPLQARLDRIEAAFNALRGDRPGLSRGTTPTSGSLDGRLQTWYVHYGTQAEAPMAATDPVELEELEWRARDLLRRDGTLQGPDLDLGPLDVAVGDRVVTRQHLGDGPPPGTLGTVVSIDMERMSCTIDFATWGTLHVADNSEEAAVLVHDYATLEHAPGVDPVSALQAERERAMVMELEP